jgi:hypothetical protein
VFAVLRKSTGLKTLPAADSTYKIKSGVEPPLEEQAGRQRY